jgi:PAS domain S-box-containing protein
MFGYAREELVGSLVEMLVPEAKRQAHAQHRSHYATTHIARPMGLGMELYGRTKDGSTFPVEVSLGPLLTTDQPMISSTVVDITERKKLEEQLRVSQRLEAVGQLASGIAHDFNNILTAISGNTKLALADLPTGHPVQQNLEEIDKAALRATKVVRQTLSFSRQDPAKREPVALASVVDEAMKLLRAGLRANIKVETEYDANLPLVSADSTQIHQIVMNLATNAADAIGDKAGILKLKLSSMEADDGGALAKSLPKPGRYICLSLSDNGCGIDPVTAGRIFEPFFTTKGMGKGTGIGLATVRDIVELYGGRIVAASTPGAGSTFTMYLPAA